MNILMTYDLTTDHSRIRSELKRLGWLDTVEGIDSEGAKIVCNLPNTTFIKVNATIQSGYDEMLTIVREPVLERLIVVEYKDWRARKGLPIA